MYAAHLLTGLLLAAHAAAGAPADLERLTDAEVERRAEAAFRQGTGERADPDRARRQFAEAATCYEALRRRGAANVELFRNLGNACLLADQLPEAILAYRRALRWAPHDRVLRDNLEYARDQVQYTGAEGDARPPADAGWPAWLPSVDGDWFLLGVAVLYALACLCLTRELMTERGERLRQGIGLLVLAAAGAALWGYLQWRAWGEADPPVVVVAAAEVPLRRGNGPTYPSHPRVATLHRGMEARLLHRRGGWLQIELPGGAVGWVPQAAVLVDEG